jgi:hypothetical protein
VRELTITMADVRGAAQCSRGARMFFKMHNLDWQNFLENGINAGVILDTGDIIAESVVLWAAEARKAQLSDTNTM